MSPQPQWVCTQTQDHICTLTLNRPQAYNALSNPLMQTLLNTLRTLANQQDCRVIIIKGEGRGFCAGHDLKELTETKRDTDYYQRTFSLCSELMQQIQRQPQPVIAQVHGIATAAGCQLVASCDLAIADTQTRFATPGVNIGLFCSTPMVALSRTLSKKHALEMLLLGDMISAQDAYRMGLVNLITEPDDLEQAVQAWAQKLASKSAYTLKVGKEAFYRQAEMPIADAYRYCSQVMTDNIQAKDAREGIGALLEKRAPQWSHSA